MSPRVWTAEELARVWPLPGGWHWEQDGDPLGWDATLDDLSDSVFVCFDGTLGSMSEHPPLAVVLAVIGAHQGRDSVETLGRAMDERADDFKAGAAKCKRIQDRAASVGVEQGLRTAAAMLRAGRVPK